MATKHEPFLYQDLTILPEVVVAATALVTRCCPDSPEVLEMLGLVETPRVWAAERAAERARVGNEARAKAMVGNTNHTVVTS